MIWDWLKNKKTDKSSQKLRAFVGVRMEAIGGQGAHSAGKILAEAAVLGMKFTGNHFSSFGSEKRGTPVRSFVRFSTEHKPVRSASFIHSPDILVFFHDAMLLSRPECLEGAGEHTDLIVNTANEPSGVLLPEKTVARRVIAIDATRIARKIGCGTNAVMLGAIARILPEIENSKILDAIQSFFAKLPAAQLKANLDGFSAGAKQAAIQNFLQAQARIERTENEHLPRMGWQNAPIGGVIENPGNTILNDHAVSRKGTVPRLLSEVCFHCGYCDMVCPDFCFVWKKNSDPNIPPQLEGIDYQYCKACEKCIAICPVQALISIPENELTDAERNIKLFRRDE